MTRLDLEDGKLLRKLIALYQEDQSNINYTSVLICLRDSNTWVCGNAELAGDNPADGNIESLGGYTFTPEILQSEDGYLFFPIFSSLDEISQDYRDMYSVIEKPFVEVLDSAKQNDAIFAVVVDPFTKPFVITSEMFDFVLSLDSNIEE